MYASAEEKANWMFWSLIIATLYWNQSWYFWLCFILLFLDLLKGLLFLFVFCLTSKQEQQITNFVTYSLDPWLLIFWTIAQQQWNCMQKTSRANTIKHLWDTCTIPYLFSVEKLDTATNPKGSHCIDELYVLGGRIGKELQITRFSNSGTFFSLPPSGFCTLVFRMYLYQKRKTKIPVSGVMGKLMQQSVMTPSK